MFLTTGNKGSTGYGAPWVLAYPRLLQCDRDGEFTMNENESTRPPLGGQSPYELRVNLGKGVPESEIRTALATGEMGFLHSYTTGSTIDGPGVRVVAWTTGCHWRCRYCHNPDTWSLSNGIPISVERATEELSKHRFGLRTMSGGFTINGGEPLMQDRFVVKLLAAAKSMGIHTAIETNGALGDRLNDDDLKNLDLVLLGLKTWGDEQHRQLTTADQGPTLNFARRLAALKKPVWIRFVLVPGVTDDPGDIAEIGHFASRLGNVERIDVLPFHQRGHFKWNKLGLNYTLESTPPPTEQSLELARSLFRAMGLKAA